MEDEHYFGTQRYNLRAFWAANKTVLPIHYAVYLAEVGCKKAAAANVESVFSGAGKFADEASSVGPTLLQRVTKLHYNWKYPFLRPAVKLIVDRYNLTFRPKVTEGAEGAEAARVGAEVAQVAAAAAPAPAVAP